MKSTATKMVKTSTGGNGGSDPNACPIHQFYKVSNALQYPKNDLCSGCVDIYNRAKEQKK